MIPSRGVLVDVCNLMPCKLCGRNSWCSRTDDGLSICRRPHLVETMPPGTARRTDRNGTEYVVVNSNALRSTRLPAVHRDSAERAAPDDLNRVYRFVLDRLDLSPSHISALQARSLSRTEIDWREYRTLPAMVRRAIASAVMERFGAALVAKIPGFAREHSGQHVLRGACGIVVPVRDLQARIIALKVRADDASRDNRYSYISSKRCRGPGPGAPVHVPLFSGQTNIIRITEGELKADVATVLSGVLTISVPGATNWRPAVSVVDALAPRAVRLAYDADWKTNPMVRASLEKLGNALANLGLCVEVETWDQRESTTR